MDAAGKIGMVVPGASSAEAHSPADGVAAVYLAGSGRQKTVDKGLGEVYNVYE